MDQVEGHAVAHHHPQPLEGVSEKPRRFIDVVHWSVPCLCGNGRVVRLDRLGHAVEDFLDGLAITGVAGEQISLKWGV